MRLNFFEILEHSSELDPKYRKKIETIVRKQRPNPNDNEELPKLTGCPFCTAQNIPESDLYCSQCKSNLVRIYKKVAIKLFVNFEEAFYYPESYKLNLFLAILCRYRISCSSNRSHHMSSMQVSRIPNRIFEISSGIITKVDIT